MLKRISGLRKLYVPLIVCVLLLVPFIVYQRVYVKWKESYLADRSFRILTALGNQLQIHIDVQAGKFAAAGRPFHSKPGTNVKFRKEWWTENFQNIDLIPHRDNVASDFRPAGDWKDGVFTLSPTDQPSLFSVKIAFQAPGGGVDKELVGRIDLGQYTSKLLDRMDGAFFDNVLFCDTEGKVLYQYAETGVRIRNMSSLPSPDVRTAETRQAAPNGERTYKPGVAPTRRQASTSVGKARDNVRSTAQPDASERSGTIEKSWFESRAQASSVVETTIGGAEYRLFMQPVSFIMNHAGAGHRIDFVACGVWRSDRLHAESSAIPYREVIWGCLTLLAAFCFTWPFLKVSFMSPKERFRKGDGWVLILSILFAAVLITTIVMNGCYEYAEHKRIEADLGTLAQQIKEEFNREMATYHMEAAEMYKHGVFRTAVKRKWEPATNLPFICDLHPKTFHQFDQVFWAEPTKGTQMVKLLTKPPVTPQTDLKGFPFFDDLQRNHFFPNDNRWKPDSRIQPLRSPNTGEYQIEIAITSDGVAKELGIAPKLDGSHIVQVMVTRPLSVIDPVLPPDYGFAVLDPTGKVQLHSDSIRNLQENFLAEADRDPYLAGALLSGKNEILDIRYMGQPCSVYVTPLIGGPSESWTLIVYRYPLVDRTAQLSVVLFTGVLLFFPAVVLIAIAALDILRGGLHPPEFLWPRMDNGATYLYVALTNWMIVRLYLQTYERMSSVPLFVCGGLVVLAAVALLIIRFDALRWQPTYLARWLPDAVRSWRPLVLLLAALALIANSLWIWTENRDSALLGLCYGMIGLFASVLSARRIARRYFPLAYSAAAVSVLAALAIVPTIACFTASARTVERLRIRQQELTLRNAMLAREQRIDDEYRNVKHVPDGFISARKSTGSYYLNYFDIDPNWVPRQHVSWLEGLFAGSGWCCVPSNSVAAEMIETANHPASQWSFTKTNNMSIPSLRISDKRGLFPRVPMKVELEPYLRGFSLVAVVIGFYFWMHLLIKRLFLPKLRPAPSLPGVDWKKSEDIAKPCIVIGHARSGKSTRLRGLPGLPVLDLAVELPRYIKGDSIHFEFQDSHKAIAVDHFEFNIDDVQSNLVRLEIVEQLLYVHDAKVVLVSTVDPLHYISEEREKILVSDGNSNAMTLLFDRWSRALSKLTKVEFRDDTSGKFEIVRRMAKIGDANTWRDCIAELKGCYFMVGAAWRENFDYVKSLPDIPCIDLRRELSLQSPVDLTRFANASLLIVDHFEYSDVEQANAAKLDILETLLAQGHRAILVFSASDPLPPPEVGSVTGFFGNEPPQPDLLAKWTDVLDNYPDIHDVASLAQSISRECDRTAYLRRTGIAIFTDYRHSRRKLQTVSFHEDLIGILLDRVDSYYGILWASFTESERLVMYQLAKDGWVNPLNQRAIQQLQRKEFICREAMYKILNVSFRDFVLSISNSKEVLRWQHEEDESSWRAFRMGLIIMFIALTAWLLYAQKDLFQVSIGYLVAIGGILPAILNFLVNLRGRKNTAVLSPLS